MIRKVILSILVLFCFAANAQLSMLDKQPKMNSFIGFKSIGYIKDDYYFLQPGIDGFYQFRNRVNVSSSISIENMRIANARPLRWHAFDGNFAFGYQILNERFRKTTVYPKAGFGYRYSNFVIISGVHGTLPFMHRRFVYGELGFSVNQPILDNLVLSAHTGLRHSFVPIKIRDENGRRLGAYSAHETPYQVLYFGFGVGYILTKSMKTITPQF